MVTAEERDALLAAAGEVRQRAYAPYSNFRVGAAVLTDDGRIFTGVNVENASYGLTVCAERTAVGTAVSAGVQHIVAAAVSSDNGVAPCGACRQVLREFADDIPIWLVDAEGAVHQTSLYRLLPDHFGPEHLAHLAQNEEGGG
jgi:cytidine deaminase